MLKGILIKDVDETCTNQISSYFHIIKFPHSCPGSNHPSLFLLSVIFGATGTKTVCNEQKQFKSINKKV